ncbi:hypothetical protein RHMOL_Rhmol09G0103300 [Rhododendron molle]|uniref:Uncharacterized protein n=1 Tax=Rhododendron molle TaxID=49168 RepID=A0ACC0MBN5_RHOML|nr:hypothetical protein RHMOL_Rhmol09G0103300 [Rhododendron molle]
MPMGERQVSPLIWARLADRTLGAWVGSAKFPIDDTCQTSIGCSANLEMDNLFIFIFNLFFRAPAMMLVNLANAGVGRAPLLMLEGFGPQWSSVEPSDSGLAHPIIVISSDFESSRDDSEDLFIREYLERHRSRRQTSSSSSDSNAERDYEYDSKFNTEPEITFSPSTHSDTELELGLEAESKFRSQAEATTSSRSKPSET